MEALLLIIGELVAAILFPFIALVIEFVASLIGLTVSFGFGGLKPNKAVTRTAGKIGKVFLVLTAGLFVILLVINSFFFKDAVHHIFGLAEKRSNLTVACDRIDGSLFSGQVDLGQCTIRRASHPKSTFDLSVSEVKLDLKMTSLFGTATLEKARIVGLTGAIQTARDADQGETPKKRDRPRRAFVIDDLHIEDIDLKLSGTNPDGNAFDLPVVVHELKSKPLRSRLALFDILFRSNVSGSIAAMPFTIVTSTIENGRETAWRAEDVPVASLGAMTGGVLSWFKSGVVNVAVDDRWQRGDALSIDMDWQLAFSRIEVAVPDGTSAFSRAAAAPIVRYVNSKDGNFPLDFEMVVNEDQFEFQSSLAAAGLWTALGESVNSMFSRFGIDKERAAETGNAIKDGAKSVLDRLRKPKSDDEETE